jgi:hypothetical protein
MQMRIATRVPGPAFDLATIQEQVHAGDFHVYKSRALTLLQSILSCTERQARQYARQAVLSLQPGDYAHTLETLNGQLQDVYGKVIDDDGWYLKIEIHVNDGQAGIISCHPAEHDIVTLNGIVPRAGKRQR